MQTINFGNTGLRVSRLCLGCMSYGSPSWRDWVLDENASMPFFARAFELGINFFDTADVYSLGESERILGRAMRAYGARREDVVIATKVFFPMGAGDNNRGLSRKHIMHAIDESLRRLGTDYVDVYQIHRLDRVTPMEEVLEALHAVVQAGKALYLGASSMYAWEFSRLLHLAERHGLTRFVSMQNHYNLVYREEEREMLPLCRAEGVAVIPWSPLARGFLTGNRTRDAGKAGSVTVRAGSDAFADEMYFQEDDFAVVDAVSAIAKARGVPNAQVALAWLLAQDGVTAPIVGATKLAHLEDAASALDIVLSSDELAALAAPYKPHPVLGNL
ncbi:MAG: aldo/keto reductase [Proteobacteria bacterium]|nr:aldo/keto reductase [Pseudomonadota bacterium]MBK8959351.1 aldo/keto reductase [Pseudomonadota bacterium]